VVPRFPLKKSQLRSYAATLTSWLQWLQFRVTRWLRSTSTPQTAAICTIALHEEPYIDEWIQYHLKLGFDHIYVYDNSPANPLQHLPQRYPQQVTVIPFPGPQRQMPSYRHFVRQFRHRHTWAAFIDVDEFVVLRQHKHILGLLQEYCPRGALGLHWVIFDSNNHRLYEDRPVLERFTRRHSEAASTVKLLVYLPDLLLMKNPHVAALAMGQTRDCHGRPFKSYAGPQPNEDVACIYHYFTKSEEEFRKKCERGRADLASKRDFDREFVRLNTGAIQDRSALKFFRCPLSEPQKR
jgi:hypothetical protein